MSKGPWDKPKCKDVLLARMPSLKPMLAQELAAVVGFSYNAVRRNLKAMHAEGIVRVASWERVCDNHISPRFAIVKPGGRRADAQKPMTVRESKKCYPRRKLSDEEIDARIEVGLRRELETRRAEARAHPVMRHPMDVALFGEYKAAA